MALIDYETQEPIACPHCGEKEYLCVVEFVFGSQVHCETCGNVVC